MIQQYCTFVREVDRDALQGKFILNRENTSRVLQVLVVLPRGKLDVELAPRWWDNTARNYRPPHEGSVVDEAAGIYVSEGTGPMRHYVPRQDDLICDTIEEADRLVLWLLEEVQRFKAFAEGQRQAFSSMIDQNNAGAAAAHTDGPRP